jgi:arylsulfatase A-like enzyme/Tfp pilus assembly protein PilF
VAGLAAAGTGAWYLWPQRTTTAGGVNLGRPVDASGLAPANLVVITLDTTRADHIGAYGSTLVKTPAIDALAREGVLFDQAGTTAPLTLPAHASIFTGRYPPEHGARDNGGFFLGPEQVTLAEVLKARGFQTGAFIAAYVLDSKWGVDQGFDTYLDDFDFMQARGRATGSIQRPANEVVDKALPWIDQAKGGPFFAWIHLYDPHTPYDPPEPYKTEYAGHPYRGEVAFADAQVGRVVAFLRERNLLDRTVVAVLGDHGEGLGDHGENSHGFFIYESAARVPFVIRAPFERLRGRAVADPVRVIDLMPTVLSLLGVPVPREVTGASLLPLMTGDRPELGLEGYAEAMYPLHHYGWSDIKALRSGRYKAIDAPRPELYDLQDDPGETRNLFDARRALGDQMLARLRQMEDAFQKVAAPRPAEDVDPDVRARLAALGYVGSFVASASAPRTNRADPKDKIAVFNLLSTARELASEASGAAKAEAIYKQITDSDPNVIDVWFSLGGLYAKQRRYTEAIASYARALKIKPDYDLAVFNLANMYRRMGNDDAALAGFQRYLAIDAKDAYVHYQMGEIYLDRGDVARAEQSFSTALAIDPNVAQATNALGVIAFQRGDTDTAERLVNEALAKKADVRLAHYNLALIAEKRGDLQLAEKEYLLELEAHPDSFRAAFNLSRLYEQIGEPSLEIDALRQAIDANPDFGQGLIYLARAYVRRGGDLREAERLAQKGLKDALSGEVAALGHYVLADVYNRQGRAADAAREVAAGRAKEARK